MRYPVYLMKMHSRKKYFTSLWLSRVHLSSTAAVFKMKLLSTSMRCFPLLFCQPLAVHTVNFFLALFLIHFRRKHRNQDEKDSVKNNGILIRKLFWPTVRKKCSSDREKLLKFSAFSLEFSKTLRSLEQFIQTVKGQNNYW